jgi:hypothetical protein
MLLLSCGNNATDSNGSGSSASTTQATHDKSPKTESQKPPTLESIKGGGKDKDADSDPTLEPTPGFTDEHKNKMYKGLIQGEWLSSSDPSLSILIEDDVVKFLEIGEVKSEMDLTVNGLCNNVACKDPNGRELRGWCLLFGSTCHLVTQANPSQLTIKNVESSNVEIYRKPK